MEQDPGAARAAHARLTRLVILRAGALGDTILTLPAIHCLRAVHPSVRVTLIGSPASWEVAGDLVDETISIDRPLFAGLFGEEPGEALIDWLRGFDRVIAWTVRDPTPAASATVPLLHASPYPPPEVHASCWLVQTLDPLHLESGVGSGDSWHDHLAIERPRSSPPQPLAFLHPGAGALWKRWPADRFARLAGELTDRGWKVEIVEGPADGEAVAGVLGAARHRHTVVRLPSVSRLANRLAQGTLFIGNDSGVTHLAAAAGLPTLALFGPTDPASWAPLRSTTVVRACTCRATRQGQIRVCDDPRCMERITIEQVLDAVPPL